MKTSKEKEIIRHALGLNQYPFNEESRNYYVSHSDAPDFQMLRHMCDKGLLRMKGPLSQVDYGDCYVFFVTEEGRKVLNTLGDDGKEYFTMQARQGGKSKLINFLKTCEEEKKTTS